MAVNKAIIIGRLGQDPETRYTSNNNAVTNFSVATSEKYNDKEYTEWHRVVAFKRLAEICGEYLKKGSQVYVEGRLQTRSWVDKENNTRHTTEIIANTVQYFDSKSSPKKPQVQEGDDYPF